MTPPRYAIRPGWAQDAAAITAIYNHYVHHSAATLQTAPSAEQDFAAQLSDAGKVTPLLVADEQGSVVGYAYADVFKSRCGYRHSYESSIYVAPAAAGRGIGEALMRALIAALADTPAYRLIAIIALPNPASVKLHKKLGFNHCGTLPASGWKFNQWYDSSYWMLSLKDGNPGA